MVIAAPNNNGQLVRWLERKGLLCFEVTFFATAALFFVAFSTIIIAVSLIVGGLFVAGVVLFGAADVQSLKVNKVDPPAQTKETTMQKDPTKQDEAQQQESATKEEADQKKDGVPRQDDAQKQDSPKRPRKKMRKRMKQMK